MGLLDKFKKTKESFTEIIQTDNIKSESFTTYRDKINILDQKPYIDTNVGDSNFVHFYLDDNLMPQKFNQLYNSGPTMHADCINTTVDAVIGGGISFINYDTLSISEQTELKSFMRRNKLEDMAYEITLHYKIHNRINIKVKIYEGGLIKFEAVDPAEVRYNKKINKFWVTEDWYTQYDICVYALYTGQTEPGTYMLEFDGKSVGTKPYALPKWNTGFLDIVNAAEIPLFHRANMDNSVNPGLIVNIPFIIEDPKEKHAYISQFKNNSGAENTSKTTFLFSNGKENLPEITQVAANPNDKQFDVLTKNSIEQICYAHQMNPSILGVQTPGSLGMNQELLIGYEIFENTVVKPMRKHITKVLNELYSLSGIKIKTQIVINEFQLFNTSSLMQMKSENTVDKKKED